MDADFPAAHSMDSSWFAVDQDGHVAYFDTGAEGAVPNDAAPGPGAYMDLMEDFDQLPEEMRAEMAGMPDILAAISRLIPATKPKRDLGSASGHTPEAARHGLFVYASEEEGLAAPYTRDWLPVQPIHIDQLPPEIRDRLNQVRFPFRFTETQLLQPLEHAECATWGPVWLSSDGKKIRAVPGREDEFAAMAQDLRQYFPDAEIEEPPRK